MRSDLAREWEEREEFLQQVARMWIEGECRTHGGEQETCNEDNPECDIYEPMGNDDEVDALYGLIHEARRLLRPRINLREGDRR